MTNQHPQWNPDRANEARNALLHMIMNPPQEVAQAIHALRDITANLEIIQQAQNPADIYANLQIHTPLLQEFHHLLRAAIDQFNLHYQQVWNNPASGWAQAHPALHQALREARRVAMGFEQFLRHLLMEASSLMIQWEQQIKEQAII